MSIACIEVSSSVNLLKNKTNQPFPVQIKRYQMDKIGMRLKKPNAESINYILAIVKWLS